MLLQLYTHYCVDDTQKYLQQDSGYNIHSPSESKTTLNQNYVINSMRKYAPQNSQMQ